MVLVSIVVTTFNDSKFIVSFLNGLAIEQSVKPDEIIVVDGGSKDNTVEILNQYARNSKVSFRIISDGKRRNISEGINEGIKQANNEWVMIMGTGNSYNPDFIKMLLEQQEKCTAQVIYSSIIGVEKTKFAHFFNQYFLRGNKSQDLDASNHGVLIHKHVFDKIGYFWEHFIYAGEDLEYFARVRRNDIECVCVTEASAYWDTPQTFKEYLKKMRVNSIADWQMFEKRTIWKKICLQMIVVIAYIALGMVNKWFLLFIVPFIGVLAIKKKTSNLMALLLGVVNRFVMVYYYIKNRKYAAQKYHVPEGFKL